MCADVKQFCTDGRLQTRATHRLRAPLAMAPSPATIAFQTPMLAPNTSGTCMRRPVIPTVRAATVRAGSRPTSAGRAWSSWAAPASRLSCALSCYVFEQWHGWNAGKYTVPVLWDKKRNTIVNNESADIVRMLNERMNKIAKNVSFCWLKHGHLIPVKCACSYAILACCSVAGHVCTTCLCNCAQCHVARPGSVP